MCTLISKIEYNNNTAEINSWWTWNNRVSTACQFTFKKPKRNRGYGLAYGLKQLC